MAAVSSVAARAREYGDEAPALTREQWKPILDAFRAAQAQGVNPNEAREVALRHESAALHISQLPDDDRRKLNWDYVDKLREIAHRMMDPIGERPTTMDHALRNSTDALALHKLADIVASYLPPRDLVIPADA